MAGNTLYTHNAQLTVQGRVYSNLKETNVIKHDNKADTEIMERGKVALNYLKSTKE